MSKSAVNAKRTRVQQVCTLWTHDDNFSRDDVVFNGDKFTELPATPGSLIQIIALKQGPVVRDFQAVADASKGAGQAKADGASKDGFHGNHSRRGRRGSVMMTLDESGQPIQGARDLDLEKSYIFVAKPTPTDLKSRNPNLQVGLKRLLLMSGTA